jgi:Co/Zn/Cd efflux system component
MSANCCEHDHDHEHLSAADTPRYRRVLWVALAVNVGVAWALYRFRSGDSNMRSVWLCSRNDAIGNVAVMAAAIGVFGTGRAWPDLVVAAVMAGLALNGGWQVARQARRELSAGASHAHADADAQPGSHAHSPAHSHTHAHAHDASDRDRAH